MAISTFQAVIQCKCPRCRKGNMFTDSWTSLRYGRRAHINCPVCGLRFEVEPGFYEGGLYFNYAMNVAILLSSGLATYILLNDPNKWVYFGISAGMVVLLVSLTSRLSKSLMLHIFGGVKFEPESSKKSSPLSPKGGT